MNVLILGAFFSLIGIAYFIYGKKQSKTWPMIIGLILIVFPYLVSNIYMLLGFGIVLTIIPYFFRE